MKQTDYSLPYMVIGHIALNLIQLPNLVSHSVYIIRMHFHGDINSN